MSGQVEEAGGDRARPPITRLGVVSLGVALIVVGLDQISKYWILEVVRLADRGPVHVLPFFQLQFVRNPGVSFGLLRADTLVGRWLLVLFALAVVGALASWARNVSRPLTALALGLVMGGALGNNLIDRVRFGWVVDFLDFQKLMFPWIFNVADSAISVGVALLLLDIFLQPKPPATA